MSLRLPDAVSKGFSVADQRKSSPVADPFKITILIFSIIAFMYFAGEVLKPLALSVLLSFALAPVARILERCRLPRAACGCHDSGSQPGAPGAGSATWSGSSLPRLPTSARTTRKTSRTS